MCSSINRDATCRALMLVFMIACSSEGNLKSPDTQDRPAYHVYPPSIRVSFGLPDGATHVSVPFFLIYRPEGLLDSEFDAISSALSVRKWPELDEVPTIKKHLIERFNASDHLYRVELKPRIQLDDSATYALYVGNIPEYARLVVPQRHQIVDGNSVATTFRTGSSPTVLRIAVCPKEDAYAFVAEVSETLAIPQEDVSQIATITDADGVSAGCLAAVSRQSVYVLCSAVDVSNRIVLSIRGGVESVSGIPLIPVPEASLRYEFMMPHDRPFDIDGCWSVIP